MFVILSAILMMVGEFATTPVLFNNSTDTVAAKRYKHRTKRTSKRYSKTKIWTGDYKIVGNKRSKIFHVIHGRSYRMNLENAVFFKSKAAAIAAGYRESKR